MGGDCSTFGIHCFYRKGCGYFVIYKKYGGFYSNCGRTCTELVYMRGAVVFYTLCICWDLSYDATTPKVSVEGLFAIETISDDYTTNAAYQLLMYPTYF